LGLKEMDRCKRKEYFGQKLERLVRDIVKMDRHCFQIKLYARRGKD
jgi:hypothetical protein